MTKEQMYQTMIGIKQHNMYNAIHSYQLVWVGIG